MTQLDIELDLCKKNFKFFIGYCFLNLFKTRFMFYDFHNELIDVLLNIKETPRAVINAPPRIGKTEILKHYIAWRFLNDPSSSVIYISYEERLVARKNREIKDLLLWLSKRFDIPELRMLPNVDGKTEWVNQANGTVLARGSNNGVTGSGCSTILLIDDPNKPNDRSSPLVLSTRNNTFVNTIRNRINDPSVPIVVLQQRVAATDLSGFLLGGGSNETWQHFNFPAIKADGTALCPERLPLHEIETYKNDPFTYNAQYLQSPLDDIGKLFNRNKIILADSRPPLRGMRLVIAVDAAGSGAFTSDFNAIAVIGMLGPDYYILDVANFRADITLLLKRVREMRTKWGATVPIMFEARANGTAAAQILRKEMSGVLESHPKANKIERAILVKYLFDGMNVHFSLRGLVWGEVLSQFTQFPHCKHDDIVDAVVLGLTWLQNLPKQELNNTGVPAKVLRRPVYGGPNAGNGYNPTRRF